MPRFPKPFFRTARNSWFVQLGAKQINLGPDEAEALRRYHELMAKRGHEPKQAQAPPETFLVVTVLDLFLDWCKMHKAPRTYDWYRDYLQSFADSISNTLTTDKLRPFHVQEWVDSKPGWKTGKRGAIIAVQRTFNWAEKLGHIERSPIRHMEKPPPCSRKQVISENEFADILACVKDQEFQDLLVASWQTGARPNELWTVEARHFDEERRTWTFPPDEAKGKKRWRVVYLSDEVCVITKRLAALRPRGPLFRNTDGVPWCVSSVKCRFQRIRDKLGTKYSLYAVRHSFCQRLLEDGVNHMAVAELMGHHNGQMVAAVYSHMNKADQHLRDALDRANG